MAKKNLKRGAGEVIIFFQSFVLVLFGTCGFTASSTLLSAFKALTNAESAAFFITDDAILTDTGKNISTDEAEAVIKNFEFVCTCCLAIGAIIFISSCIRIYKSK